MLDSSRRLTLPTMFLVVLAACLPRVADAQPQSLGTQARAIQAFQDAAEVVEAIDKAKAWLGHHDVSRGGEPVAVMLRESCGVAGCYYSYLVSQLITQGEILNAQSTSVSAVVKFSLGRGQAAVTLVDLANTQ